MLYFTRVLHLLQTKKSFFLLLLTLLFIASVYLKTIAPSYTWKHWGSDAGDLLGSIYTLGVPHPPGTPLYILLCQFFRLLPFSDPAFRINLASTFFALLSLSVLFSLITLLTKNPTAASLGLLYLAFSFAFWSQAIITEVYTLNVFLIGLVVYLLIRWALATQKLPFLYLALFSFGLSLCNHTSALMLLPAIFYLIVAIKGRGILSLRFIIFAFGSFFCGLLPYLYIPLRARTLPPFNWSNPQTLPALLNHVFGREYARMLFYKNQWFVVDNIVRYLLSFLKNFNFLGLFLAVLGILKGLTKQRLLLKFSLFAFLFQILFYANYKIPNIETFYLPSFFLASLWIGLGTEEILSLFTQLGRILKKKVPLLLVRLETSQKTISLSLGDFSIFFLTFLLLLSPFFNLFRFFGKVDCSKDREAVNYAEGVFRNLAKRAIVITEGDKFTLVLQYYRWIIYPERGDIAVFPNGIYLQKWRLEEAKRLYPWVDFPNFPIAQTPKEAISYLLKLIEVNWEKHPVYLTLDYPPPKEQITTRTRINSFLIQSYGPIYKVIGKER